MSTIHIIGTVEAARILGLTRQGLHVAVRSGRIKPLGTVGDRGVLVFDRADIERQAEEQSDAS